jgi:hypothetical protein
MASFMTKVTSLPRNMPHGTARPGFQGFLVDKGTRWGAAAAFGYAKGYLGDKFLWRNHGIDMWTGATLTGIVALANIFSPRYRGSAMMATAERVGDAGLMSAFGSLGAYYGMQQAGRSVAVVSPGKNGPKKQLGPAGDFIGVIPAAAKGSYLTADQIARFAASR